MTPETKEMREATQPKSLEETQIGPVVAVQYPAKWKYSENEESAGVIAQKYAHFKALSPDDKEGYKDLVLAIADVRTRRTDVAKQEKVIKDPLNKFRDVVIKTSKHIRGLLGKTEDDLKVTKQRIDDTHEERKLAMRKLWQDNLDSLRTSVSGISQMGTADLVALLNSLEDYDFESLDFGEYIEQAKSTVAISIGAINERIDFLVEQQRLADEMAEFEKKQAESDRKQAETDAENKRLREQLEALTVKNEPQSIDVTKIEEVVFSDNASDIEERMQTGNYEGAQDSSRAAAIEREPGSTVNREEENGPTDNQMDANDLVAFARQIETAINNGPGNLYSGKANRAVTAVYDQLEQIISYLNKTAESLR